MITYDYGLCPKCRKYGYLNTTHKCPPEWDALYNDIGIEDADTVRADNAEEAALDYASGIFCDLLCRPDQMEIKVRSTGTEDEWQTFRIEIKLIPDFTAYEVDTPKYPLPTTN